MPDKEEEVDRPGGQLEDVEMESENTTHPHKKGEFKVRFAIDQLTICQPF